jgi:CRISPR-associated protein Csb2
MTQDVPAFPSRPLGPHPAPDRQGPPIAFRWRLDGVELPPLTAARPLARAVRAAIMRQGNRFGLAALPDDFHHGGEGRDSAYYLPEDIDGDGWIDHIVCLHEPGLPAEFLPAMAAGGEVRLGGGPPWALRPVFMGGYAPGGVFGPARCWHAVTPFITPLQVRRPHGEGARGPRRGRSLTEQILRQLEHRDLPPPIEVIGDRFGDSSEACWARARAFLADDSSTVPPGTEAGFPALTFARPIWGPVAIGLDCHFGLGLFVPPADAILYRWLAKSCCRP